MLPPPPHRRGEPPFEVLCGLPAEKTAGLSDVERTAWLPIRPALIPDDPTAKVAGIGNLLGQFANRDLGPPSKIHRRGFLQHFCGTNNTLGGIIHLQKLPRRRAGAPAHHLRGVLGSGFLAFPDQGRNDMA